MLPPKPKPPTFSGFPPIFKILQDLKTGKGALVLPRSISKITFHSNDERSEKFRKEVLPRMAYCNEHLDFDVKSNSEYSGWTVRLLNQEHELKVEEAKNEDNILNTLYQWLESNSRLLSTNQTPKELPTAQQTEQKSKSTLKQKFLLAQ